MTDIFKRLETCAKQMLSEKRLHHTRCVVKQAGKLARIHHADEQRAMIAAWAHDLCKEMPYDEQLQWIIKYGIILDSIQLTQEKTWHGMAACGFVKSELGIADSQILDAIRYHTTARRDMTLLDEVVYLADLTSEERSYADVNHMRMLAEKATGPAMKYALQFALFDLVRRMRSISKDSFEAYNYYLKYEIE